MKKGIMRLIAVFVTAVIGCTVAACGDDNAGGGGSVSIFSRPTVARKAGQKKDWLDVSSFAVYYGSLDGDAESEPVLGGETVKAIDRLKEFDVAIIHSQSFSESVKPLIKELQDAGTYVIAYISIGEERGPLAGDGLGEGGNASYYIYENGAPKMNGGWGSFFVDAGNPVWQQKTLNSARNILSYGVDGLFLDTLDTVDVAYNTIGGMAELVKKLDNAFPDAKLVANRGFTVFPYISNNIDGLMFESFSSNYDSVSGYFVDRDEAGLKYNQQVACNVINRARRYDYMPVFCLEYVNLGEYGYVPQGYYNNAWEYDFIPYATYSRDLDVCPNPNVKPATKRGALALKYMTEGSGETENNGDTSAANLAYAGNELCTVTVDSTFAGYSGAAPLNDGFYSTKENHDQNKWATVAWASSNDITKDHWIQFTFANACDISKVIVYWAVDNGTQYSSREVYVEAYIDGEWQRVSRFFWKDGETYFVEQEKTEFIFDSVHTDRIRIYQPKNMGDATTSRTDGAEQTVFSGIMWVSEVAIYEQ